MNFGSNNTPRPLQPLGGILREGAGDLQTVQARASAPSSPLYPKLVAVDQALIDQAMKLGELLHDEATVYLSGITLFNLTGNPKAKELADLAKCRLVNLLATPFGFEPTSPS